MGYPVDVKAKPKKAPVLAKKPSSRAAKPPAPDAEPRLEKEMETVLQTVAPPKDDTVELEPIDEWVSVSCPFCGENIDVHVTSDEEGQTLTEDCEVCCRPVSMTITIEEGEVSVEAYRS